ncbi:hypothetical protein [Fimbriimonas ginsengisoli]|nr:hypothetical protein [Fimbriimonas ginsengisoli]
MTTMFRKCSVALPLLVLLAGCGGSSSRSEPTPTPNVVFTADVTSSGSNIKQLNGGTKQAGTNTLSGPSTLNGNAVTVEVLANVDYTNGSGQFFGFITVTLADSSLLTMHMTGTATKNLTSGNTAFSANLTVVGGTGVYANATGSGHFNGSRTGVLGAPVHMDVEASVH